MVSNTSPDPSVAANLASMLAETSVTSPGATGVQPPRAASGESSFLTTLDAVADGGGSKCGSVKSRDSESAEDVFDTVMTSEDLVFVGGGVDELCGGNVGSQGEKW